MIGMQLSDFPIVCAMAERWCMVIIPKLKSFQDTIYITNKIS